MKVKLPKGHGFKKIFSHSRTGKRDRGPAEISIPRMTFKKAGGGGKTLNLGIKES